MKINEITRGSSGISLEAKVVDKSESRKVNTKFGPRSVADITIEDDTGQMTLSLWEEKIDSVKIGDKIKIEGAYVTEFRDRMQLNIKRDSKLEIINE